MLSLNHNFYWPWDVLGLYRQIFGHVGIPIFNRTPVKTGSGIENDETYIEGNHISGKFEAWDVNDFSSTGKRTADLKGNYFMMPLKLGDYQFPIEPLISISGSKTVIETKVTGLKAPVVEEVSMDSYKVTIKGVYINEDNDDYPYRDVRRLPWLLEKRGALTVENKLLSIFDINYLVIKDLKCDGVEGHQSMQWYILEAIADRPIELVLKDA